VDAITGEGLCLAFQQASALADAIESGELAEYQRKHRQFARRPESMEKLLIMLGGYALFRRVAMRAMHAHPTIFARMLALHVGAKPVANCRPRHECRDNLPPVS